MKGKAIILILFFVATYPLSVIATQTDNNLLIAVENIDLLEKHFTDLEARFDQGEVTEYDMLNAYKTFYLRDDTLKPVFDNWVSKYPDSSTSYLARGVYFRKLGEFRRGTSYISQVPGENINYMKKMHHLAKRDLYKALEIKPDSYITLLHLINIAQFESDDQASLKYLNLANKILPSNFIVRARYLISVSPRWGGSHQQMEEFINSSKSSGVSQDLINRFLAILSEDKGDMARERGNSRLALKEYTKSLIYSQSSGDRFRRKYLKDALKLCLNSEFSKKTYCRSERDG